MNYKEVIEAKYSREAWQGLLYDIFHNKVKFWRTPTPIHVSSRFWLRKLLVWETFLYQMARQLPSMK